MSNSNLEFFPPQTVEAILLKKVSEKAPGSVDMVRPQLPALIQNLYSRQYYLCHLAHKALSENTKIKFQQDQSSLVDLGGTGQPDLTFLCPREAKSITMEAVKEVSPLLALGIKHFVIQIMDELYVQAVYMACLTNPGLVEKASQQFAQNEPLRLNLGG